MFFKNRIQSNAVCLRVWIHLQDCKRQVVNCEGERNCTWNCANVFSTLLCTSASCVVLSINLLTHFTTYLKKFIFQLTGSWVHPGEYASSGKRVRGSRLQPTIDSVIRNSTHIVARGFAQTPRTAYEICVAQITNKVRSCHSAQDIVFLVFQNQSLAVWVFDCAKPPACSYCLFVCIVNQTYRHHKSQFHQENTFINITIIICKLKQANTTKKYRSNLSTILIFLNLSLSLTIYISLLAESDLLPKQLTIISLVSSSH